MKLDTTMSVVAPHIRPDFADADYELVDVTIEIPEAEAPEDEKAMAA